MLNLVLLLHQKYITVKIPTFHIVFLYPFFTPISVSSDPNAAAREIARRKAEELRAERAQQVSLIFWAMKNRSSNTFWPRASAQGP